MVAWFIASAPHSRTAKYAHQNISVQVAGLPPTVNGVMPAAPVDWVVKYLARPFGAIFLNLLFLAILPLVFASLALGVTRLGGTANVGRIEGGHATNIIPEQVHFRAEARSHDPARLVAQVAHMRRCPEEAVWVESAALERALGGASHLKTGARVTLLSRGERKLDRQLQYANRKGIPVAVIAGESELDQGQVAIKDLKSGTQTDGVPRRELAARVAALVGK